MVGLKKGNGGGVIPTTVVGLGFLLVILIQTTTAQEPPPLTTGQTKKVSELYATGPLLCASPNAAGSTAKERVDKFLMHFHAEPEDPAAFEAGIKACCVDDQATPCPYDTGLGVVVLKYKAPMPMPTTNKPDLSSTKKDDKKSTTAKAKAGASGIGGFSEKVILITVLAGKLFL